MSSAIHLTPSGVGQALMLTAIAVGGVLVLDSIFFMIDEPSILAKFNVAMLLNDKLRGAMELAFGILLVMFGSGKWVVQVGWLAIAALVCMTSGVIWSYSGSRGVANQHYTTVATKPAAQQASVNSGPARYECPLSPDKKAWCDEDHDKNGVLNRYDPHFNSRGQGIRNCRFGTYITSDYSQGCKKVK